MGELLNLIKAVDERDAVKIYELKKKREQALKQIERQSKWRPPDGDGCA